MFVHLGARMQTEWSTVDIAEQNDDAMLGRGQRQRARCTVARGDRDRRRIVVKARGLTVVLLGLLAATGAFTRPLDSDSQIRALRAAVAASSGPQQLSASWALADALADRGELLAAERVLREAASAPQDETERRSTALRLASVLTLAGQIDEAQKDLLNAQAGGGPGSVADRLRLHNVQGILAERTGDFARAERAFDTEAVEAHAQGQTSIETRARLNALRAHLDQEQIDGVAPRLQTVDTLLAGVPQGDVRAQLELSTGELYERAVHEFLFPVALRARAYADLIRGQADARSDRTRAYAAGLLGEVYEDAGQNADALRLTSQAVFLAQSAADQDQLYRWEWQAARLQQSLGDAAAAQQGIDDSLFSLSQVRDDVLHSSRQAFAQQIEPVYLTYADLHLRAAAALPDGSAAQQKMLRDVRDELESLKRTEIEDYFDSSCTAAATANAELDIPGTAVIYPIILPDRLEVLVETGGVIRRFAATVPESKLIDTVRGLRIALEQPASRQRFLQPAQQLYGWLLKPADTWLEAQKVTTLVYVPGGALRTVPLAALHDGKQFVIERYAVATTPAISLIPTLGAPGARQVLLAGITQSVQGFPALPDVDREIHTVDSLLPAQVLEDKTFTLASIDADLTERRFSVAHLATHGVFSADHRRSFVLTYDNRLTLDQLQDVLKDRQTPLDLLVLSACDTAAGDDRAALGLAGVAVQSGARSALASLWSISDVATARLMQVFYEDWKSGADTKAQSLRAAQLALLHSPDYAHPSYWAPYLMIGDWR